VPPARPVPSRGVPAKVEGGGMGEKGERYAGDRHVVWSPATMAPPGRWRTGEGRRAARCVRVREVVPYTRQTVFRLASAATTGERREMHAARQNGHNVARKVACVSAGNGSAVVSACPANVLGPGNGQPVALCDAC